MIIAKRPSKKNVVYAAVLVMGIAIGLVASRTFVILNNNQAKNGYNLLAKRLLIDNPNDVILDFKALKNELLRYLDESSQSNKVGVYFEYLPTGTSIGINETEQLAGASLLKTPLAINLYKTAQDGKINLDDSVALKKEWLNSQYGSLYKKGAGYRLTLRELAEIMLEDSDNTAALAIYDTLSNIIPLNQQLLTFIDSEYGINKDESVRLGPESYSQILKCLYFACYTNKDSSQEILHYLTESKASDRLKLYVPNSTVVAHKIGSYESTDYPHVESDCGIFYVPNRNYLLCVMVKDTDPQASRTIGELSKIVYDRVISTK